MTGDPQQGHGVDKARREEQVTIESDGEQLFGTLYTPGDTPVGSILICNPVFEEHKAACRALAQTARVLSSSGFTVLRFDYRGCGDSGGDFSDFAPADWRADIGRAAAFLQERSSGRFGVLGLRLGATLALQVASGTGTADFDFLVLWEPVVDGADYFEDELRKRLMKEMMTHGKSRQTRQSLIDNLKSGDSIDFSGYSVSPGLYSGLKEKILSGADAVSGREVLIVSVSAKQEPPQSVSELAASLPGSTVKMARLQPFWNLVGHVDCTDLVRLTEEWVCEHGEAG